MIELRYGKALRERSCGWHCLAVGLGEKIVHNPRARHCPICPSTDTHRRAPPSNTETRITDSIRVQRSHSAHPRAVTASISATVLGSRAGVRLSNPSLVIRRLSSIRTPPTYQYFSSKSWFTNWLLRNGANRCVLKYSLRNDQAQESVTRTEQRPAEQRYTHPGSTVTTKPSSSGTLSLRYRNKGSFDLPSGSPPTSWTSRPSRWPTP